MKTKILPPSEFLAANRGAMVTMTYCSHGFFIATVTWYAEELGRRNDVTRRGSDMLSAILTATDAAQGYDNDDPIQENYR